MTSLYSDPHFTFRFADDRIVPRFHLAGVEVGLRVSVFQFDAESEERGNMLAVETVGDGGWVQLRNPIIVRTGDAFVVVPESAGRDGS